jgi:2-oxoglutarate dehydrogenase E1 component
MTPKSLLRHPDCVSTRDDLTGGAFQAVLDDPRPPARPRRLVFCTGKVWYDLAARREKDGADDVAVYRIELLYPFPVERIAGILERHADVADVVWLQEEPQNMGAFSHVRDRLPALLAQAGHGQELRYVGRPRSASTASGSHKRHLREQDELLGQALATGVRA